MISNTVHTEDWLNSLKGKFKGKNPVLIEKVVKAFALLEDLKINKLNFIFKGGTSLLLLIKEEHRFSVDIDINISEESEENKELRKKVFEKICEGSVFERYEENIRAPRGKLVKEHYKFFYKTIANPQIKEDYIILDIVFSDNPYNELITQKLDVVYLEHEGEVTSVQIPSANDLVADKLATYAPNTTGIKYETGKYKEIIKQLFDVSKLFETVNNLDIVLETFKDIAEKEIDNRGLTVGWLDVLKDVYTTSLVIAHKGHLESEKYNKLKTGINSFGPFVHSKSFNLEDAVLSGGKAAYLASLLADRSFGEIKKYEKDSSVEIIEDSKHKRLNKLMKKVNPEALYYFSKAIQNFNK